MGEHFKKVGEGLTITKNKLNELKVKISDAKNADGSTIKVVEDVINGVSSVFEQLIAALIKLDGVTKEAGSTDLGDAADNATAVVADKAGVEVIISEVKNIIDAAEKSGVKIEAGNAGNQVAAGAASATAVLVANAGAGANAGPKFAEEVSKADPWAMIDKIKNTKTNSVLTQDTNNEAGVLATAIGAAANVGAKSTADLAAAVALKAMTKAGKFSVNSVSNEAGAVKAAAAIAVNKVLGVLDIIVRKIVVSNLEKVREAVNGIQYSKTTEINVSEVGTTQIISK